MRKPTIWVPARSDTNWAVVTEDGLRLEISDLRRGIVLSEWQLVRSLSAPLFSPIQIVGFLMHWLNYFFN